MYNNIANIFKLGLHQVPRSKEMSGLRNSFSGLHSETTGRNIQRLQVYIRQIRTVSVTAVTSGIGIMGGFVMCPDNELL